MPLRANRSYFRQVVRSLPDRLPLLSARIMAFSCGNEAFEANRATDWPTSSVGAYVVCSRYCRHKRVLVRIAVTAASTVEQVQHRVLLTRSKYVYYRKLPCMILTISIGPPRLNCVFPHPRDGVRV